MWQQDTALLRVHQRKGVRTTFSGGSSSEACGSTISSPDTLAKRLPNWQSGCSSSLSLLCGHLSSCRSMHGDSRCSRQPVCLTEFGYEPSGSTYALLRAASDLGFELSVRPFENLEAIVRLQPSWKMCRKTEKEITRKEPFRRARTKRHNAHRGKLR